MNLYVEGGGDSTQLRAECRKGFAEFLEHAGFGGQMPRIIACGGRTDTYRSFCIALNSGTDAMLLIDSEEAISEQFQTGEPNLWRPWEHLAQREGDHWQRPPGAQQNHCHLMVECMENWFFSDQFALSSFFGQGFKEGSLPRNTAVETISKKEVYSALSKASRECKTKARYGKGAHSFKILARIDPEKLKQCAPWAKRFLSELETRKPEKAAVRPR